MLNKNFTARKIFLAISLFTFHFFSLTTKAQEYNPEKIERPTIVQESIVYPDSDTTKPGQYLRYYTDIVTENGTIEHGLKSGDWYYFNLDGSLMFSGHFKNGLKTGRWEYFDSTGLKRCTIHFSSGLADSIWTGYSFYGLPIYKAHYVYGGIVDTLITFHENGIASLKLIYQNGTPYKLVGEWDIYGNELTAGDFKFGNGILYRYYPYGQLFSTEQYNQGTLNGNAAYLNIEGVKKNHGIYVNGARTETWQYLNYDNTEVPFATAGKPNTPFDGNYSYDPQNKALFNPAHYPGGNKLIETFLKTNMVYPAEAYKLKISGTVWLNFEVDELGHISDIKLYNSINEQCDAEAIYLVKNMPNWMPALQQGIPVKSRVFFPVEFKL